MTDKFTLPWRLFLDDDRDPEDVYDPVPTDLVIARTCDRAEVVVLARGLPVEISFDHDLGENEPVSTAFMWFLINGHLDEKWDCAAITHVQIHSANPEGVKNLRALWAGFIKEFNIDCKITQVKALKR